MALVHPKTETVVLKERFEVRERFGFFIEDKSFQILASFNLPLLFINQFFLDNFLLLFPLSFPLFLALIACTAIPLRTQQTLIQHILILHFLDILLPIPALAIDMIPPFTVVTADPLVIVFIFAVVGVDLLAKFAVEIVEIVVVAGLTEETVLVVLHTRTDLLVDFLGRTHTVEAFATAWDLLSSLG